MRSDASILLRRPLECNNQSDTELQSCRFQVRHRRAPLRIRPRARHYGNGRLHNDYLTGRFTENVFRNAAKKQACQSGSTVGAHNDEVAGNGMGNANDLFSRLPFF